MRKHAILSASSAALAGCPPSARLEQEFESNTSIYVMKAGLRTTCRTLFAPLSRRHNQRTT